MYFTAALISAIISSILGNVLASPPEYDHGVDLPTIKPLIIAHRGASGILPEHTVEAYKLAIEQGADIIECDVSVTKDLKLVCLHESWMNGTTDVADKFPETRSATYYIIDQDKSITDYFSVDFTLAELKTIHVNQRLDTRDLSKDGLYTIATLEEYIEVAKTASRTIGIYPETKEAEWVNSLDIIRDANTTFERLLLDVLEKHDYTRSTDPCFVQSFSLDSLKRMQNVTNLPLIRLMRGHLEYPEEELDEIKEFCYGIGPSKTHIVKVSNENTISEITDLIKKAHDRGLRVHPYTFRNEHEYLAFDYGLDPHEELEFFLGLEIDGYFTDFPATLSRYFNATYLEVPNSGVSYTPAFHTLFVCLMTALFHKIIF